MKKELSEVGETTELNLATTAHGILLTYLEEERLSDFLYLSYKPVISCSSLLNLPFLSNCQALFSSLSIFKPKLLPTLYVKMT